MAGWGEFVVASLVFYGSHMIPARPGIRRRLTALLGDSVYLLLYVLLSLALLAWLIEAAARAPFLPLWQRALWQNVLPQIAMLPACWLIAFGIGAKGGLSLGFQSDTRFDPARPGIAGITRHPVLWALLLWSLSHLAPNGDLAHAILFGAFAATALLGMIVFDRRTRRRAGEGAWQRIKETTAFVPLMRGLDARGLDHLWLRWLAGLALYAALLWLHMPLIGLSPI